MKCLISTFQPGAVFHYPFSQIQRIKQHSKIQSHLQGFESWLHRLLTIWLRENCLVFLNLVSLFVTRDNWYYEWIWTLNTVPGCGKCFPKVLNVYLQSFVIENSKLILLKIQNLSYTSNGFWSPSRIRALTWGLQGLQTSKNSLC